MAGYVTANSTMHFGPTGALAAGDIYPADDPLVKEHPDWFTPLEKSGFVRTTVPPAKPADTDVEQATAAPGEKRATKKTAG